jgi:hypothetical protein
VPTDRGRGPSRPAARMLRAAAIGPACLAVLTGCLILPLSDDAAPTSGKAVVRPSALEEFRAGESTRADVLLRLGEPTERRGNDRVFVYGWEVPRVAIIVFAGPGFATSLGTKKCAAIRFDDRGIVSDAVLIDPSHPANPPRTLDEWAGPDAPPPPPAQKGAGR